MCLTTNRRPSRVQSLLRLRLHRRLSARPGEHRDCLGMTRRRQLSDEERALWKNIARSVKPLRKLMETVEPLSEPLPKSPPPKPRTKSAGPAPHVVASPKSPPLAPLDRRLKQRVARGREPIEARLDLHGMTQAQAHTALLRFLRRAHADGVRTVLVVTGKGLRNQDHSQDHERGVLRRQVPMWLALPEFRLLVVGFDAAHVGHGGQGALYVRLRRTR
jgi:DNA-nicking Smr family endonuclease